jgi:hypothetical protein
MRIVMTLALALTLAACGPDIPDLDGRLSDAARNAPFPNLIPLGPVLRQGDATLPRDAATEGTSLEARADSLRRRAAALRRMPIN